LSSKPRAIQQRFEMNALSENDRAFRAAKIAETAFVGKSAAARGAAATRRHRSPAPGRFEQFKSIPTIAMHSNGGHRT
jgi:hypothetical protein